eukprot:2888525-Lingulodinium_polyedra.AAC.1
MPIGWVARPGGAPQAPARSGAGPRDRGREAPAGGYRQQFAAPKGAGLSLLSWPAGVKAPAACPPADRGAGPGGSPASPPPVWRLTTRVDGTTEGNSARPT